VSTRQEPDGLTFPVGKPTAVVMVPPIEYVLGYRFWNKVQP